MSSLLLHTRNWQQARWIFGLKMQMVVPYDISISYSTILLWARWYTFDHNFIAVLHFYIINLLLLTFKFISSIVNCYKLSFYLPKCITRLFWMLYFYIYSYFASILFELLLFLVNVSDGTDVDVDSANGCTIKQKSYVTKEFLF